MDEDVPVPTYGQPLHSCTPFYHISFLNNFAFTSIPFLSSSSIFPSIESCPSAHKHIIYLSLKLKKTFLSLYLPTISLLSFLAKSIKDLPPLTRVPCSLSLTQFSQAVFLFLTLVHINMTSMFPGPHLT